MANVERESTTCKSRTVPSPQWVGWLGSLLWVATLMSLGSQGIVGQSTSAALKKVEAPSVRRTPDGQPDLQGVWSFATLTPLQRPPELAGKEVLTPEEAAKFQEQLAARREEARRRPGAIVSYNEIWNEGGVHGDWTKRTSLITDPKDGRLPPMTPEAEKRHEARAQADARASGPEDFSLADRCIRGFNAGPPMIPGPYNNNVQLFQTRDAVVIYNEMVHHARIVPLDGRPALGSGIRRYSGDSRGRFEGDTLIVETTNFVGNGQLWINWGAGGLLYRAATDQNLHLVERFTRTDGDTLLYEFTVNDPTVWTRPWSAAVRMSHIDERLYEYACHEANYGLPNMLENARAAEKGPR